MLPFSMVLSIRDMELFNDSLERCLMHTDFLSRFYDLFLASDPRVAEKFQNTNFTRQRRMLKSSLYLLIFVAEGKEEGFAHMNRIAELHRGKLQVPGFMYDLWLRSLLQSVSEFDVGYNADIETAWRNMLANGIEYIKARI